MRDIVVIMVMLALRQEIYIDEQISVPLKNHKKFIREYKYNASDSDSKISSRKKAIRQLKAILSEEVGVYIQTTFDIEKTTKNEYIKSEIKQLSTAITKLKILEETWNGVVYYVKASVRINEEEAMVLLTEAIKAKSFEKDVTRLNKILKEQNTTLNSSYDKIKELRKKLVLQEIENQASKAELEDTMEALEKLQKQKEQYDDDIIVAKDEINKAKKVVLKAKSRIKRENERACVLVDGRGMTKDEVISAIGKPTATYTNIYDDYYEYGTVSVVFDRSDLLSYVEGCK